MTLPLRKEFEVIIALQRALREKAVLRYGMKLSIFWPLLFCWQLFRVGVPNNAASIADLGATANSSDDMIKRYWAVCEDAIEEHSKNYWPCHFRFQKS